MPEGHRRPPRREADRDPATDRVGEQLQGAGRSRAHEGRHLGRRGARREVPRRRHSGRYARSGHGVPREVGRGRRRARRRRHGRMARWQAAGRGDAEAPDPQGRDHRRVLSGAVRLGVQEQGRAAAARRGRRLSSVPARRAADHRHGRQGQRSRSQAERQGTDVAARVQDHGRSVRRHDHVLPHLFGHAHQRHRRHQFDQGPQGAHRPHAADARQQPRRHQGSLCGRHRRARRPEGSAHRRHAVRPATSR